MPKQETVEASIKRERALLQRARDRTAQKKSEIDQELVAFERELRAIDAYE